MASARTGQRWDGNQELIGQGLAKLTAAGVRQAYPVSGSSGAFGLPARRPAPAPAWPRWRR